MALDDGGGFPRAIQFGLEVNISSPGAALGGGKVECFWVKQTPLTHRVISFY